MAMKLRVPEKAGDSKFSKRTLLHGVSSYRDIHGNTSSQRTDNTFDRRNK
jgi:hypothetical protein